MIIMMIMTDDKNNYDDDYDNDDDKDNYNDDQDDDDDKKKYNQDPYQMMTMMSVITMMTMMTIMMRKIMLIIKMIMIILMMLMMMRITSCIILYVIFHIISNDIQQIKGVPKKVSHSDFRVYVGQNKCYQYILNMSFIIGIRINGIFY